MTKQADLTMNRKLRRNPPPQTERRTLRRCCKVKRIVVWTANKSIPCGGYVIAHSTTVTSTCVAGNNQLRNGRCGNFAKKSRGMRCRRAETVLKTKSTEENFPLFAFFGGPARSKPALGAELRVGESSSHVSRQ